MIIGIDASRAYSKDRAGVENYSNELIWEMVRLPEAKSHQFRLYVRAGAKVDDEVRGKENVEVVRLPNMTPAIVRKWHKEKSCILC